MRWHFGATLATVFDHNALLVDRKALVGVDGDTEQARVSLLMKNDGSGEVYVWLIEIDATV